MDTISNAERTRPGAGMTAPDSAEHRCSVPGYLHLPDLAMIWQCADCGETWQVVSERREPDGPLEFAWVRDPILPVGSWAT